MPDLIEDFFAFLTVTEDEPAACSVCGRELAEGERYILDEGGQVICSDCRDTPDNA